MNKIKKTILYGDNEPLEVELRIALSFGDWCRMKEQGFYRELEAYLEHLRTRNSRELQCAEECLTGIEGCDKATPTAADLLSK